MPDDTIPEGNIDFEPSPEVPKSKVYYIKDNKLVEEVILRGKRSNLHDHTEWSGKNPDNFISTLWTEKIGVRESQTSIDDFYMIAKRKSIDFVTASEHDSIQGSLKLMENFPNDTYASCEYTVNGTKKRVKPGEKHLTIHVGCPGLDFPIGGGKYSFDQVAKLHKELMKLRGESYETFAKECERMGVRTVLNHAAWLGTPELELEAKLFLDWINTFRFLEINGCSQYENVLVKEMAERYNKILVAGTDDHRGREVGRAYVETLDSKVSSIYQFFEEFDKGNIGIGSRRKADSFEKDFNGDVNDLRKDAFRGVKEYFLKEWGPKKWKFIGAASGTTLVSGSLGYLALGIGGALTVGILPLAAMTVATLFFPYGIPLGEKWAVRKRTIKLHDSLVDLFNKEQMESYKAKIDELDQETKILLEELMAIDQDARDKKEAFVKNKLMKEFSWLDNLIIKFMDFKDLSWLRGNYNFSVHEQEEKKIEKKKRKWFKGKGLR